MLDLNITLLFQLGNFFVAIYLLNILLIRPVRDILKKRKAMVEGMTGEAENFESMAEKSLADYEASLQKARQDAAESRQKGREEGVAVQHDVVSEAQNEARNILDQARSALKKEADETLVALRAQTAEFSKMLSDRLIKG